MEVQVVPRNPGQAREIVSWPQAKRLIFARDGGKCLRCLGEAEVVHHRRVRGMGGSGDPAVNTGLANLLSLCSACHLEVHLNPARSYSSGYLVRMGLNPEDIPVVVKPGSFLVRLGNDGSFERTEDHAFF